MASNNNAEVSTKPQLQSRINVELPMTASQDERSTIEIAVQSTHSSHGHEFPVTHILRVIKDVLDRANESMECFISGKSESAVASAEKISWDGYAGILKEYASTINKISCELSCKCEANSESTTSAIFNYLSDYFCDAKVLITQLSATNPLAMSVSLLKQPDITVHANSRLDTIKNLLKGIWNVTKSICKFQDILQTSNEEEAIISDAAHLAILSMVACSSQINILLGTSGKYITPTTEAVAVDVPNLDGMLTKMQHDLDSEMDAYQEKRFREFIRIMDTPNTMRIITPLIRSPLLDGSTDDKRVSIKEVLEGKTIVLLISSLDIVEEELFKLKQCHNEKKTGAESYEIVWIPLVDISESREDFKTKMQELRMPWYIVADPWSLDPRLIRYMKKVWKFSKEFILVVLDSQGKVVCENALNMFSIWGNRAYPFTTAKEKSLWNGERTWGNELLVEKSILKLRLTEPSICLYGGSDAEWIGNFVTEAEKVAKSAGISLEMFYAGKRKANERVKKITTDMEAGKIHGRLLPHQTYFWFRLESLLESRVQNIDRKTANEDRILREVLVMLSFGKSDKGWAVFCEGSTHMVSAHGDTTMIILKNLSAKGIKEKGLVAALSENLCTHRKLDHSHCNRITIPWTITEEWLCPDCGSPMEMYITYRCCTD